MYIYTIYISSSSSRSARTQRDCFTLFAIRTCPLTLPSPLWGEQWTTRLLHSVRNDNTRHLAGNDRESRLLQDFVLHNDNTRDGHKRVRLRKWQKEWRLKHFLVKRLLVHLGGRYNVRTNWEEDIDIPICRVEHWCSSCRLKFVFPVSPRFL